MARKNGNGKASIAGLKFRVAGHRAKTVKVRVSRGVYDLVDRCEITFEGVAGHKHDKIKILVDDKLRSQFPYKAIFAITPQLQEEFDLEDADEASSGAEAH